MKKSMLLSTVAMIVIVVVALSTATYAWFTSTNTVSASTEFQATSATSDLLIRKEPGSTQWNTSIAMAASPISPMNPTIPGATLAWGADHVYDAAKVSQGFTAQKFFTAVNEGNAIKAGSIKEAPVFAQSIQVRNNAGAAKDVTLKVSVKAGMRSDYGEDGSYTAGNFVDAGSDKSAARSLRVVVVAKKVVDGAFTDVATFGTNYQKVKAMAGDTPTAAEIVDVETVTVGNEIAYGTSQSVVDETEPNNINWEISNKYVAVADQEILVFEIYAWFEGHVIGMELGDGKCFADFTFTASDVVAG